MEKYDKTVWANDETDLNEDNMNKIENQLEALTDNAIQESQAGYVTETNLNSKGFVTETSLESKKYIDETELNEKGYQTKADVETIVNNLIGSALGGEY